MHKPENCEGIVKVGSAPTRDAKTPAGQTCRPEADNSTDLRVKFLVVDRDVAFGASPEGRRRVGKVCAPGRWECRQSPPICRRSEVFD